MTSLLLSETITLRLRAQAESEDRYKDPVYGPPEVIHDVAAWWEPAASDEQEARSEMTRERYWVYTEDNRLTYADQVVLHGSPEDLLCDCAPPLQQPGGLIVDGFVKVLVERHTG
ncbi:hypothetical protein K0651_01870 [Ornithinimicrobium sp. Arc0846-15]|nr:hypothetical protein [Ornithinimicrobium laminariae]